MKRNLFILDLDHTVIYGSYGIKESAEFLFQHNKYLKIYERPLARELIDCLHSRGDVIVYTTAKKDYAMGVVRSLAINVVEVLTRSNCPNTSGNFKKNVKKKWREKYGEITIIDDSPQVWFDLHDTDVLLSPSEFRGYADDYGLEPIIAKLKQ